MKTSILAAGLALVLCGAVQAQKKEKEVKYNKLFYKDVKQETDELTIVVDNAVSTDGETKFKLKITNKTGDFIILKPEECKFVVNGKEMAPKEKWMIIRPNESDSRIINLKGPGYNAVKSYSFVLAGLYKATPGGKVLPAGDFRLPASTNDVKVNEFTCTLTDLSKQTDKTEAKFKCTYNGSQVGFIDPAKTTVKMPDGNEYVNAKKTGGLFKASGPTMFMKGTEETITMGWERMQGGKAMDMQKVAMDIIWHEAFSESPLTKLKDQTLPLAFDEVVSNEKGK